MEYIDDIEDLIAKVLAKEATVAEQAELAAWIKVSDENHRCFADMKRIWTESGSIFSVSATGEIYTVDTEGGWNAVQKRIQTPIAYADKPLTVSWLQPRVLLQMAAAIAVLLVASLWFFNEKGGDTEGGQIVAKNRAIEKILTDKSTIKLAKASILTTAFTQKERRVKLEGEAFFAVAPDTTKPFVVEVKNLEIKVVGTQFNVDNVSEAGKIIVKVTEGKVLLSAANEAVFLTKDMTAIFEITTGKMTVQKLEQNEMMPSLNFKLNKRPMRDVVRDLSKYFKIDIQITSPNIENCLVNTDYSGQKIEAIILVLTDTYDFEFIKTEKGYSVKGEGCNE